MEKVRTIIIDGIEMRTSLSAIEIANMPQKYSELKKALNEIKDTLETCKKLMPYEFDWEEQADNILEKIYKVLGEDL